MSTSFHSAFTVQILSGQTNSTPISCDKYHDAAAMLILSPATLPETVRIQVNNSPDAGASDAFWCDLVDSTGANITIGAAGKAKWFTEIPSAGSFRLVASVAVAADREFKVSGSWTV